jgi:hypothetical protein
LSARVLPYRLPVLPPGLDAPGADWAPKENFSPSSMATYADADGCKRKWAWGACFGVWGARKSLSTLFGSLIHGAIEHYLQGRTFYDLNGPNGEIRIDARTWKEFQTQLDRGYLTKERLAELALEAPKRALAGQSYLPNIRDAAIQKLEPERWCNIDTTRVISGIEPLRITAKVDLRMLRAGVWYLFDHKSTKGKSRDPWAYAKTPEQLYTDPQAVFYALDIMLEHGIDSLWIRWTYFLTDPEAHPLAKAVDVQLTRTRVFEEAFKWLVIADEMRRHIRAARAGTLHPDDLPANPKACPAFGGCGFHYTKGGPCMPEGAVKLSDMVLTGNKPEKETPMSVDLAAKLAEAKGLIPASAAAPVIPPMPFVPPEAQQAAVPVAAPAQAALPAGWHWFNGTPRADAPAGCFYADDGKCYQLPTPAAAPPHAPPAPAIIQTTVGGPMIPPPLPAAAVETPATPAPAAAAEAPKGRGRPKGAKNKVNSSSAGPSTFEQAAASSEVTTFDRLLEMACAGDAALRSLTVAQMEAIGAALDA